MLNVTILLKNVAPVEMPWIKDVNAVLGSYLGDQAGSGGAVDLLFGDINPSGKLAETFPLALHYNSSCNYFPGNNITVEYQESIYVGCRYYDTAGKKVLFPFGHGLGNTKFEYSDLKINKITEYDYEVELSIKNTGDRSGSEVVQLYIGNNDSEIFKEEKRIQLKLSKSSFDYYNTNISDWHVDGGEYGVQVGASSGDIRLCETLTLSHENSEVVPNYKESAPNYYKLKDEVLKSMKISLSFYMGKNYPLKIKQTSIFSI